ncbi:hypothetical protein CPC698_0074 [Chlamydia psittaci C6/98]|nr:hypothetical protein CPC698_0074 [Chlamydia psittaci C6/98]
MERRITLASKEEDTRATRVKDAGKAKQSKPKHLLKFQ